MGPDAVILVFWMLNFKPTFLLSSLMVKLWIKNIVPNICNQEYIIYSVKTLQISDGNLLGLPAQNPSLLVQLGGLKFSFGKVLSPFSPYCSSETDPTFWRRLCPLILWRFFWAFHDKPSHKILNIKESFSDQCLLLISPPQISFHHLFKYLFSSQKFSVSAMCESLSHVQLCNPMYYSPPGSSVHGIFQAGVLEWVSIPFSRESSWPRDWPASLVSCIDRWIFDL